MNERTTTRGPEGGFPPEEQEVRRLLEKAGSRPEVPPEHLAAIQTAFRAEWETRFRRTPRRPRWQVALPLAAAVLLALGAGWWWWKAGAPAPPPAAVARVERVEGTVVVRSPASGDPASAVLEEALETGQELLAGAELETAETGGRAALRLASGLSLRLDAGSRGRLLTAAVFQLDRGAVYADTGAGPGGGGGIEIRTALGVARDVGTQFEVRLLEEQGPAMRVRVREGTVLVERGEDSRAAEAGTELALGSDGSVRRGKISRYGSPWAWVLDTAPRPAMEGWTLARFLAWVGRETGWEIRFADPGLEASAGEIHVYATLGSLTPEEAPAAVLPGAGLGFEVVDGVLVVRRP